MEKKNKEEKKPKVLRKKKTKTTELKYRKETMKVTPTATIFTPELTPTPDSKTYSSNPGTQAVLARINEWLNSHSTVNTSEQIRRRNLESYKDFVTLEQTVTEFMDTFLLVGYNLEGQRVLIQRSKNNRDQDALVELLRNITIMPTRPPTDDDYL